MVRNRRGRRVTAGLLTLGLTAGLLAFMPAASAATIGYTCEGDDAGDVADGKAPGTTQGLLNLIGSLADPPAPAPVTLPLAVDIDLDYTTIEGSVLEPGETFDVDTDVTVNVPADLVDAIIGLGISAADVENAIGRVGITGATPGEFVSAPYSTTVPLSAGSPASVVVPTFGGTLDVTAPDGGQVAFTGGVITLTLQTGVPNPPYNAIFPAGVRLNLACSPDSTAAFQTIGVDQPGPPKVTGSPELTVALGGTGTVTLPVQGNPAIQNVFILVDDGDGGTVDCTTSCVLEKGTASINKVGSAWRLTYVHDINEGDGVETITFAAVNGWAGPEGNRTEGTATVTILGNQCAAGGPGDEGATCFLKQLIETTIVGDVMYMEQAGGEVKLEAPGGGPVVLDGQPKTAVGAINQITVTNPRGDGAPWSVTGKVTDFLVEDYAGSCAATAPGTWDYRCIPGDNLAWNPATTVAHIKVPGDVAASTAGTAINVANEILKDAPWPAAGTGLGSTQRSLCSSVATVSGGTFACGAGLTLVVPASASAGTYSATLTLTLT
jgi:hypothetical protein